MMCDVTPTEAEHAAAINTWDDEGGSQPRRAIEALDHDSAVEARAYLQTLRRPRLLSEATIDDADGTEEEQAAAIEAWQLMDDTRSTNARTV